MNDMQTLGRELKWLIAAVLIATTCAFVVLMSFISSAPLGVIFWLNVVAVAANALAAVFRYRRITAIARKHIFDTDAFN